MAFLECCRDPEQKQAFGGKYEAHQGQLTLLFGAKEFKSNEADKGDLHDLTKAFKAKCEQKKGHYLIIPKDISDFNNLPSIEVKTKSNRREMNDVIFMAPK